MFKSVLAVAFAGVAFFGPSLAATFSDIFSVFTASSYKKSVSDESMLYLSVESFQGPWGSALQGFMDITDNKVDGWKQIASDIKGDESYSWTLWQNKYEKTTYALACAGTDSPSDLGTFLPMMLDENYSQQMRDAMDSVRNIKNIIKTDIDELYITGHSLGGFLAMFLGTEFVDSNTTRTDVYKTTNLPIATTFGEKGKNLTLDKIHAVTFGAPGFYKTEIKFPGDVVDALVGKGLSIVANQKKAVPTWSKNKFANDAKELYKDTVVNYKNSNDPVANLFVKPSAFIHVGDTRNIDIRSSNPFQATLEWAMQLPLANVYYHAPWVYKDMLRSQK